jgi:hypothetical protein
MPYVGTSSGRWHRGSCRAEKLYCSACEGRNLTPRRSPGRPPGPLSGSVIEERAKQTEQHSLTSYGKAQTNATLLLTVATVGSCWSSSGSATLYLEPSRIPRERGARTASSRVC